MPRLDSVALSNINPVGFEALATSPDREVRGALATSPHTPLAVIDRLAHDRDPWVRRFALTRTSDVEALTVATTPGREGLIASSAHHNPAAPVEHLVAALSSSDRAVRLAAWCNPSTPLEERSKITPLIASKITYVGGSLADQVVRAHALVLANPWMLENPTRWDGNIRRALGAVYEASAESLQEILSVGSAGRAAVKAHPAMSGATGSEHVTTEALIATGSPAVDLELLANGSTTSGVAGRILERSSPPPEPIVIGHAVRRFGPRVLASHLGDQHPSTYWSGTRYAAAAWFAPALNFVTHGFLKDVDGIEKSSALLGDSLPAWETFLGLLSSWHASPEEAAQVALSI